MTHSRRRSYSPDRTCVDGMLRGNFVISSSEKLCRLRADPSLDPSIHFCCLIWRENFRDFLIGNSRSRLAYAAAGTYAFTLRTRDARQKVFHGFKLRPFETKKRVLKSTLSGLQTLIFLRLQHISCLIHVDYSFTLWPKYPNL